MDYYYEDTATQGFKNATENAIEEILDILIKLEDDIAELKNKKHFGVLHRTKKS